MSEIQLVHGDCLEVMKDIPDGSVDMILADLPYGTTQCKWDTIIPFEPLWEQYKRVIKPNGAVVLFGSQPFTSALVMSNPKWFKYQWVWQKDKATNHLNARIMPMRLTEGIMVFYKKQPTYNAQLSDKSLKNIRPPTTKRNNTGVYGDMSKESIRAIPVNKSYPNEVLKFRGCFGDKGKSLSETQKPVALLEYLIKTYTNEGESILDNCMGSGSCGVAAINTNRSFIGIEKDDAYFEIASKRIMAAS